MCVLFKSQVIDFIAQKLEQYYRVDIVYLPNRLQIFIAQ